MPTDGSGSDRLQEGVRVGVDALAYALVVAGGLVAVALVAGVATGGGLRRVKIVLFVVGWVLFALATFRLWPRSPAQVDPRERTEDGTSIAGSTDPTRIESVVAALPPRRWMRAPARQLSAPTKLFLAALVILLCSFLMEVVFDVG